MYRPGLGFTKAGDLGPGKSKRGTVVSLPVDTRENIPQAAQGVVALPGRAPSN